MQDTILNNKEKYNIVIQNFEGPLDLLLYLITKHKMSIFDICLSELTDKYVEYLDEMTEKNLDIASEFIVMAATLLDIKARRLLPEIEQKDEEEDVVTEEDIISRIIEYKKYKEVSELIQNIYTSNFGSFSKPFEKINYNEKVVYSGQDFSPKEIYDTYTIILERKASKVNKNAKAIENIAIYDKFTIQDKVRQIVNYLNENDNMVFNNMFSTRACEKSEIATAFLGVLELSKLKQVDVSQEYLFSDINVHKKDGKDIFVDISKLME